MSLPRILLLSTYASGGGAANATRRLYNALYEAGAEVRMLNLYNPQAEDSHSLSSVYQGLLGRFKATALKASERLGLIRHNGYIPDPLWRFSTAEVGLDISRHPWVQWADIIHLHWINQGFLSLNGLRQLIQLGKPIVWTLHDLWPVTGGCHLPFNFGRDSLDICPSYYNGCDTCPLLGSSDNRQGYSQSLCQRKAMLHLDHPQIHYLAVSRREATLISKSYLRQGRPPRSVIPPPLPSPMADSAWQSVSIEGYAPDKAYILFVSARLDEAVKGYHLLRSVCEALARRQGEWATTVELILVGRSRDPKALADMPLRTHYLGYRSGQELAWLYGRVASLTLSTSLFETFGQSLSESLSYGTPAVAFAAYGAEDIITDGQNGYLIPAYDTELMAERILQLIAKRGAGQAFDSATCQQSIAHCSAEQVAQQHLGLYYQLLEER
ncbi:MAG: glycosyltransferase [Porphyromonas sp.]|nr:glycosyltransferase [Porphyromonas sp.]